MQISSPRELLATIPHMLGFHPTHSVVVVAFDADHVVATVRADIDVVRVAMINPLISSLTNAEEAFLAIVYFADDVNETTDWQDELAQSLDIPVLDTLLVTQTHWRSLLCDDSDCCPSDGHPLDESSSMMDAFMVFNGSAPFRSREELVASLIPADEDASYQNFDGEQSDVPSIVDVQSEHEWIISTLSADTEISRPDCDRLCESLTDFRVRDALLRSVYDDPRLRSVLKLALHSNMRSVPTHWVAPAATVLAGCAWLDGNGVLANVAISRALDVDPEYSLAQLLDRALTHGVPPHVWAESLAAVSMDRCLQGAA